MPVRKLSGITSSVAMVCGNRWNIPMPNASWSGEASTATASGVSENRSPPTSWSRRPGRRRRGSASPPPGCRPIRAPIVRRGRSGAASSSAVSGTPAVGQRGVQTEPVAEMDHPRGDRAAQLREHVERVELHTIGINGAVGHGPDGRPRPSRRCDRRPTVCDRRAPGARRRSASTGRTCSRRAAASPRGG